MRNWSNRFQEGKGHPVMQYLFNLGLAYSQLLSAHLGGDPDESISSRCGRAQREGVWAFVYVIAPFIDFILQDKNHCIASIEDDEKRAKELWDWAK